MRAAPSSRVKLLGSLLLAVAIFAFLLRRVDVDAVLAEIEEMTWFELVTIAVIAAWRVVSEPEWGYRVDFQADAGIEPLVPGRTGPFHRRALQLRAEHRWSFMYCIVGRNNLGDIEFLPGVGGQPGMTPDLVRQSLWFDKTSIRTGGEPERLPYTVYDLPLAPPPPDGDPAGVR